jgi:outer membrane protein OmpA-like peptidoglycan-associated protein
MDYWYVVVDQEREPSVVYVYENVKHVIGEERLISLTPVEEEVAEKPKAVKEEEKKKATSSPLYVYFDFDRSKLRKDQKAKIDMAVKEGMLNKSSVYAVVGYADWIGSKRYNFRLSRRRAEEVGKYLKSLGIEKVELSWKGEEECNLYKGRRVTRSLIKALQPCMKVEIWPKD